MRSHRRICHTIRSAMFVFVWYHRLANLSRPRFTFWTRPYELTRHHHA